jgi:hypothetical protein
MTAPQRYPTLVDFVLAPLRILAKANHRLRRFTLEYFEHFLTRKEPDSALEPRVIEVPVPSPSVPAAPGRVRIPLVGLTPVPNLGIQGGRISFEQQILFTSLDSKGSLLLHGPVVAPTGRRRPSRAPTVRVEMVIRRVEAAEGIQRVTDRIGRPRPAQNSAAGARSAV